MKKILINNNEKLLLTAAISNNKRKAINSWKKWNSKNGCGIVFDVSEILKQ